MSHPPSPPRDLYTIPSSASWFAWDEIHAVERRALPEFFSGASISRNPRVYKEYRDFIINTFRQDPARRLTFTDVRRSLVGDVGSVRKVFLFLERSGLINFGVDGPSPGVDAGPLVLVEDLVREVRDRDPAVAPEGAGRENGLKMPPLTSYGDVFGDWVPRGAVCGGCGEECAPVKDGSVTCSRCSKNDSAEAKLEDESKSEDQEDNPMTGAWTDAETLLLLEAVLKHGEDWDLIAQHVRTKSKVDCIARLVQLPFGEHMLNTLSNKADNKNSSSQTVVKTSEHMLIKPPQGPTKEDDHMDTNPGVAGDSMPVHPSKGECFPFVEATGSLMQQAAILSTVAGPHVAAASAEAAVTALFNENPYLAKAFNNDENDSDLSSINKVGITSNNNEGMDSDIKVEDLDMEMHKLTDIPMEAVPEANFHAMTFRTRAAIATAFGAAAARAKLLADQEEREMEHLMATIIETQTRKIQYKMKHFEELELVMKKECTLIQEMKEAILEEWVSVIQQASYAGVPRWRDQGLSISLLNSTL